MDANVEQIGARIESHPFSAQFGGTKRNNLAHYGQQDLGRVAAAGMDGVMGDLGAGVGAERIGGIGIGIVTGSAAGSHLEADAMAAIEDDVGGPKIDFQWVCAAGLEPFFLGET